ncbi:glycosyltransferase [Paenibacillus sp. MCAF9]|uniref:glycosyltransferase n=2 Tax=unclassified Paenibacillus TaxID=185978 RepID=UPI003F9BDCA5
MNIAIDVLAILGPGSKNRGIGNYSTSQLKKMFDLDKVNNYFLLNFYEDTNLKEILNYSNNVTEIYIYLGDDGFLGKREQFKDILGGVVKKFISTYDIEVFYFTSIFDGSISYDMDWFDGVKTVATLYDIIPYIYKEKYLNNKGMHDEYMSQINNIQKMDNLLAISQSAKDDVIKHLNIDSNKISVIYAGTDECYTSIEIPSESASELMGKYDIKDQFIMCTGGDDDRKNIGDLIVAFSKMPNHLIIQYQLVVACKLSKASEERYYDIAAKHNIRDRVILTNFIPLEHLIQLYNLAHIVAFPSQYEGFGLPVVEAMACGTPVLTSNNSSLGEIAIGAAVLVDPFKVKDITRGLIEILENTDLEHLKKMGYERIKKFTWDKVSQSTLDVFKTLKSEKTKTGEKKKIAFFTPLPPVKSGISDYSVDIICELSNYFIIDVFIDTNYLHDGGLPEDVSVYEHSYFKERSNQYDDIIYQVGNSEYHIFMIDYLKQYPGTVVLHDYNLHGILHFLASKNSGIEQYKQFLYEDFDRKIVDDYISELVSGNISLKEFEFPCNGAVTNYANKIIVHSDYAKKLLLQKDIKRNVKKIPHYARIKDIDNTDDIRRRLSIDENKIVISAFGHIHETKRILPILKAYKNISEFNDQTILYLVGKPSPSIKNEVERYIQDNNLSNKVNITGYTNLDEFEDYIDITDICLNLRYPYNGETSGSLMRILSKGKCSIVNDLGSFSEVPDECCVKLKSPEMLTELDEIEMITEKLKELVYNPELILSIGTNARAYAVNELDIKMIAERYKEFINDAQPSVITEIMLHKVVEYIRSNLGANIDEKEIYKLSDTLALLK